MNDEDDFREIKVILLGDSGVGKTSIIKRYINNKFNEDEKSSIGTISNEKEVIIDDIKYKVVIWDTSGQEVYHSLTNLFVKGSNIVILVYSIESLESFKNLNYWYGSLKEKVEENSHILAVIGNKSDMIDEEVVSEKDGKKFAKERNAIFRLVSAKEDPKGIIKLFEILLTELIINKPNFDDNQSSRIYKKKRKKNKRKCC